MPTILTSVSFTQQFTLNSNPKKFTMTDTTNYSGASIPLTGVKGVFKITTPSNTVIYNNTNFGNPGADIIANLSLTNQITIPLPALNNGYPEPGAYTIVYTVQITDGVNPTYTLTNTKTVTFSYTAPIVSIIGEVDCIAPLITGTDTTNYIVGGVTPTNSRTFTLQYPSGSGGVTITNTTSANIVSSTFYSGAQVFNVTSILTYTFSDGLVVVDTVTGAKNLTVDCSLVCELYCCLKTLNSQKENARGVNTVLFNQIESQLEQIAVLLAMLKMAIACGKQEDVNSYIAKIQEIANCADDCSCNDGSPRLVTGIGLQNVNVVVTSGGAPITVTSAVAGGVTTYTVSFDQALVTKINNSYNTVLVQGSNITIADSGVVGGIRTYTINATVPAAQNRLEFLCRLQYSNFAVPVVTITNSAYLTSGSNMVGTAAVTATDIANPNWATMNNLFTCTTFQVAANVNYKVDIACSVQGADFTLGGGFGTWTAAQMKSLSDQLQPQILDRQSGSFKFRLVVGADIGVGIPLSNKFMVVYPDIYLTITISE